MCAIGRFRAIWQSLGGEILPTGAGNSRSDDGRSSKLIAAGSKTAGMPCAYSSGMESTHTVVSQGVPESKWLELIRSEYVEMPDLHLTSAQTQRFWGVDAATCRALVDTLLDRQALRLTLAGGYTRLRIRN